MNKHRIVTMLPSASEIVCALGYQEALVARSHECDMPNSIAHLPICTETKINLQKSSRKIEDQVRFLIEQGLSVYRVDGDLIKSLQPDIIITQTQCDVCAASPKDLDNAINSWIGKKPNIISLQPRGLKDIWIDITNVADALGDSNRGKRLVKNLQSRMQSVEKKIRISSSFTKSGLPNKSPKVACIEWIDPLMAAGNWIPTLVKMAGGHNLFSQAGRHSPWIDWETLYESDPDIIVIMPCGYNILESRRNMPTLVKDPKWSKLKAVIKGNVYITDGNQYFNRPGPRLAESLEILAEIINPHLFESGFEHENSGWQIL